MIELLTETYRRLLAEATVRTYRYLFDTFDASGRLTGLVGPRGVGKTTLMLQYIRDRMRDPTQAIYASADHIYFNKVNLLDFVREVFTTQGTQHFFFDEVHKHAGWEQELKNIDKVRAVVEKTVYEDVATCYRLKTENLHHFRKILFTGYPLRSSRFWPPQRFHCMTWLYARPVVPRADGRSFRRGESVCG